VTVHRKILIVGDDRSIHVETIRVVGNHVGVEQS
jgi:hypothetical protein